MPYRPPLYSIFWGHVFCKYGGWGWSEIFSRVNVVGLEYTGPPRNGCWSKRVSTKDWEPPDVGPAPTVLWKVPPVHPIATGAVEKNSSLARRWWCECGARLPFHLKIIDVSWFLTVFGIKQNQAFSGHFRQNQAKSGTSRLLEPRLHFLNNVSALRISHIHATRSDRVQEPKKVMNPYGNSFMRTLALAVRSSWVTLLPPALGLSPTGWLTLFFSLSLSFWSKSRDPQTKGTKLTHSSLRVPTMLGPTALGRRVAQRPPLFSGILRQFQAKNTSNKISHFRVSMSLWFVFAFWDGFRHPFRSGNFRQNQATSGKIRPFAGIFRQNQAESGKSDKIGQPIGSGRSLVRDPMLFQKAQTAPLFGRSFLGAFHQN